jgi:hypothetical protein
LFFTGARGQDVATMFGEAGEDFCDLCRSFALPENDFGHPGTQSAVMIDFGEAEIFERKMAQAGDRAVGRELALAHLLEEFADGFGVQESLSSQRSDLGLGIQPGEV